MLVWLFQFRCCHNLQLHIASDLIHTNITRDLTDKIRESECSIINYCLKQAIEKILINLLLLITI